MSALYGISAWSFPHIVNNILNILCAKDPSTAARLQVVCRDWHTRIKRRLFTHVWITYDPTNRKDIHFTVPLRNPWRELAQNELMKALYVGQPVVRAALSSTRVLDIRHLVIRGPMPRLDEWVGCDLQMIRMYSHWDEKVPLLPCETLVIFKDPEKNPTSGLRLMTTRAKKVVLHVDFEDLSLTEIDTEVLPDTLENITVFYPFPQDDRIARATLYNECMDDIVGIIANHFTENDRETDSGSDSDGDCHSEQPRTRPRTLTFVSPDTASCMYDDLPDPFEPTWAYLKKRLGRAPHLLANLEFLTADEHRERVGEETYRLHRWWGLP